MKDAALAGLKKLLDAPGLAELGSDVRDGVQDEDSLRNAVARLLAAADWTQRQRDLVTALILLWHDHLDAAHTISQGIGSAEGSFVHAIMHRREPDYSNSKYWWRRVGSHPAFNEIANRATDLLDRSDNDDLADEVLPDGDWDPNAFVDACERVEEHDSDDPEVELLRKLQRIEFEVLLEHLLETP